MKKIEIYTDGSCLGNPGPGGWAAIFVENNKAIHALTGNQENTTNNRMELLAVIKALEILQEPYQVELYSDSNYVVKGINEWLDGWIEKHFQKVKNVDLWKQYIEISKKHKIIAHWVKGHSGNKFNEECDKLANQQAQICKDLEENFDEIPRCENCAKCLELNIYKPDDTNGEIKEILAKYGINKICLAFDYENVATIGKFDGIGCEEFELKKGDKNG